MPRRSVDTAWTSDPAVEDWSAEQRLAYLELVLDPEASMCGCWRVDMHALAGRTGLSRQKLAAVLPTLSPLAEWDAATRLVWLRRFQAEQALGRSCLLAAGRDHERLSARYPDGPFPSLALAWAEARARVAPGYPQPADPDPVSDPDPDRSKDLDARPPAPAREGLILAPPESGNGNGKHPPKPRTPRPSNPAWEAAMRVGEEHLRKARLPGKPSHSETVLIVRCMSDGGMTQEECEKATDGYLLDEWHRSRAITDIRHCFADPGKARRFCAATRGVWE